jgi:hypothetical protein
VRLCLFPLPAAVGVARFAMSVRLNPSSRTLVTAVFTLAKGEPRYHSVTAGSGRKLSRGFCPECGSPLLGKFEFPEITPIMVSSLDDPSWFRPTMAFYTSSAQPWHYINPTLQKFETIPTAEQVQEWLTS